MYDVLYIYISIRKTATGTSKPPQPPFIIGTAAASGRYCARHVK